MIVAPAVTVSSTAKPSVPASEKTPFPPSVFLGGVSGMIGVNAFTPEYSLPFWKKHSLPWARTKGEPLPLLPGVLTLWHFGSFHSRAVNNFTRFLAAPLVLRQSIDSEEWLLKLGQSTLVDMLYRLSSRLGADAPVFLVPSVPAKTSCSRTGLLACRTSILPQAAAAHLWVLVCAGGRRSYGICFDFVGSI